MHQGTNLGDERPRPAFRLSHTNKHTPRVGLGEETKTQLWPGKPPTPGCPVGLRWAPAGAGLAADPMSGTWSFCASRPRTRWSLKLSSEAPSLWAPVPPRVGPQDPDVFLACWAHSGGGAGCGGKRGRRRQGRRPAAGGGRGGMRCAGFGGRIEGSGLGPRAQPSAFSSNCSLLVKRSLLYTYF